MREVALDAIYLYTMCAADFAITVLDLERNMHLERDQSGFTVGVAGNDRAHRSRSTSERQVCHIEDCDNPRAGH